MYHFKNQFKIELAFIYVWLVVSVSVDVRFGRKITISSIESYKFANALLTNNMIKENAQHVRMGSSTKIPK